jgi:predicted nucleic acid-binding protein
MNIFFDANILFSAAYSPHGGSAKSFNITQTHHHSITSTHAIAEAEKNIVTKTNHTILVRFFNLVKQMHLITNISTPYQTDIYYGLTHPKDIPILIAARETHANILLTLDRRHFFSERMKQTTFPFHIMTPGDFIQSL